MLGCFSVYFLFQELVCDSPFLPGVGVFMVGPQNCSAEGFSQPRPEPRALRPWVACFTIVSFWKRAKPTCPGAGTVALSHMDVKPTPRLSPKLLATSQSSTWARAPEGPFAMTEAGRPKAAGPRGLWSLTPDLPPSSGPWPRREGGQLNRAPPAVSIFHKRTLAQGRRLNLSLIASVWSPPARAEG